MARRLQLQMILETVLGSENVYFQPPANFNMEYPAIVYKWGYSASEFADNLPYSVTRRYQVTHIDRNPDSLIPDRIARIPTAIFDRSFAVDGLNHVIFNLYF